jgi:hypothetical protein
MVIRMYGFDSREGITSEGESLKHVRSGYLTELKSGCEGLSKFPPDTLPTDNSEIFFFSSVLTEVVFISSLGSQNGESQ